MYFASFQDLLDCHHSPVQIVEENMLTETVEASNISGLALGSYPLPALRAATVDGKEDEKIGIVFATLESLVACTFDQFVDSYPKVQCA